MPKISVLMPVYNGELFLDEAIKSVLNQTMGDFELLAIDDGSTDRTEDIIRSFDDNRIRYIKNETNSRLIKTLNRGIEISRGEYIARMDADDISFPQRFQRQLEFFKRNPKIQVCGSYAIRIDENGVHGALLKRPSGGELLNSIWLPNPLIHPTVMMKSELARKYSYDLNSLHCEDYDLWIRMAKNGVVIDNLTAPLLYYRVHSSGVSVQNRELQLKNSFAVFMRHYNSNITYEEFCDLIGVTSRMSLWNRIQKLKQIPFARDWYAIYTQIFFYLKSYLPLDKFR